MSDVHLSADAYELLMMYAMPHMKIEPKIEGSASEAFAELRAKGLVREGRGFAIVMTGDNLQLTGEESIEEFEAALKPRLVETPGWVVTERAINQIADTVEPHNREKAVRVMKTFIADVDPAALH